MKPKRVRTRARAAFTLVEMLVALAVTVIALAVVTNVFSISTRTASTSAAITEVQAALDTFLHNLQEDLKYTDPRQSVLVIVGRTQAASLTPEQLAGRQFFRVLTGDPAAVQANFNPAFTPTSDPLVTQYSDPRADVLAFFSQRPTVSRAPARNRPGGTTLQDVAFQEKLKDGAAVAPVQIVYGMAAMADVTRAGAAGWTWSNPQHIATPNPLSVRSPIPAQQWVLARRATIINDKSPDYISRLSNPTQPPPDFDGYDSSTFERITRGYDTRSNNRVASDSAEYPLQYLLQFLQGVDSDRNGVLEPGDLIAARLSPYAVLSNTGYPPSQEPWPANLRNVVFGTLFPGYATNGGLPNCHVATVLRDPPPELQSNAALRALAGCAWFQVEFLMPEDPRNAWDSPLADQRDDMPRWVEVPPGEAFVFVPDTAKNRELVAEQIDGVGAPANNSRLSAFAQVIPRTNGTYNPTYPLPGIDGLNRVQNRKVRLWPYAIRITVRVYDPRGRMAEPLVRSFVHRFD